MDGGSMHYIPGAQAVPAADAPAPVATPQPTPAAAIPAGDPPATEEITMATTYEFGRAQDAANTAGTQAKQAFEQGTEQVQQGMAQAGEQLRAHAEDAMHQGQAAMGQMADRSREAMDKGMKAFEEFNAQARGQMDAFTQAGRAAAAGMEQMVQQAAEFSRKTMEDATAAMRTLATAKSPNEVFQTQNDFAKRSFDNFVGEFSRLTETMMRVSNEVFEPIQSKMSEATQKAGDAIRSTMTPGR